MSEHKVVVENYSSARRGKPSWECKILCLDCDEGVHGSSDTHKLFEWAVERRLFLAKHGQTEPLP